MNYDVTVYKPKKDAIKKNLNPVILIALITIVSCQKNADTDKEIEAILNVVQDEGNAHGAHDLEGLQNAYVHDSLTVRAVINPNSYAVRVGWDKVNSIFESWMKIDMSKYSDIKHSKENAIVKVLDNSAWLICDNVWNYEVNGEPAQENEIQITFLEKSDGEWRISFNTIIPRPDPEKE